MCQDHARNRSNVIKREIGGDEQWTLFTAQVGSTRSSIQQAELGHLTPPRPRPKARFMNLAPTLKWARMVAWQLTHPHSTARAKITAQRFTDKLGWLGEFTEDIARWNACQEVVNAALTFINQQGLSPDAADQLATLLQPCVHRKSRQRSEVHHGGTEARRHGELHMCENARDPCWSLDGTG